jgi:hypothetical protein
MLEKKVSNTLRSKPVCTSKKKKKNLRTGLEPASTPQEKKFQSRYHLSQEELEEQGNVVICLLDAVIIHYALFNLALVTSF